MSTTEPAVAAPQMASTRRTDAVGNGGGQEGAEGTVPVKIVV